MSSFLLDRLRLAYKSEILVIRTTSSDSTGLIPLGCQSLNPLPSFHHIPSPPSLIAVICSTPKVNFIVSLSLNLREFSKRNYVWKISTRWPLRCQAILLKPNSRIFIESVKTCLRSAFVFSSSFDSTVLPVHLGDTGWVGWSGVLGSEIGEGFRPVVFVLFGGLVVGEKSSADRFIVEEDVPEDMGCECSWRNCFARCFISWIDITFNSDRNVAVNLGAIVFDTSKIEIRPLLRSFISTAANCRAPSATSATN